jgi:hypothetical protein
MSIVNPGKAVARLAGRVAEIKGTGPDPKVITFRQP